MIIYKNILFYALLFILLFQGCYSNKENSNNTNPYKNNDKVLVEGRELFLENCSTCHGNNAEGFGNQALRLEDKPANLYLISDSQSIEDIVEKISGGKGHSMPGFNEALTDDEIWKIANYIKSL